MLEKAIEKLKAEMESNKNNDSVQVVGEFLLQHLQENPSNAETIIQGEKTIQKSLEVMKKTVESSIEQAKKTGAVTAILSDREGLKIIAKYFGIDASITNKTSKVQEQVVQPPVAQFKKPSVDFNVELDF